MAIDVDTHWQGDASHRSAQGVDTAQGPKDTSVHG